MGKRRNEVAEGMGKKKNTRRRNEDDKDAG